MRKWIRVVCGLGSLGILLAPGTAWSKEFPLGCKRDGRAGEVQVLLMGNSDYRHPAWVDLPGVQRDIEQLEEALHRFPEGTFAVTTCNNLTRAAMQDAVDAFGERLRAGETAWVYYAGHGVSDEVGSDGEIEYHLVPVDSDSETSGTVSLAPLVQSLMRSAAARRVWTFDACRTRMIGGGSRGIEAAGSLDRLSALDDDRDAGFVFSTPDRTPAPAESLFLPALVARLAELAPQTTPPQWADVFAELGANLGVQTINLPRGFLWGDRDRDLLTDVRETDLSAKLGLPGCLSPDKPDSDEDGQRDDTEAALLDRLPAGADPACIERVCHTPASVAGDDVDGDGLVNLREAVLGSSPCEADSDSDGLNDGLEDDLGLNVLARNTDEDKLADQEEVETVERLGGEARDRRWLMGVCPSGSLDGPCPLPLPAKRDDFDGDGILDTLEVRRGLDPLAPDVVSGMFGTPRGRAAVGLLVGGAALLVGGAVSFGLTGQSWEQGGAWYEKTGGDPERARATLWELIGAGAGLTVGGAALGVSGVVMAVPQR